MKYVMFDSNGLDVPVIFPCFWNHNDIAQMYPSLKVLSAGFLKRDDLGNLYVTGASKTLEVVSRKEDLDIIVKHLEFNL
jgi:uncharacterized protein (DUF2132 family)